MANQYLFPCDCGRKLTVDTVQAGEKITCECGKEIEIPSLREIRMLEPAEAEKPQVSRPSWGMPDKLLMTGIILIGCGVIGAGLLWYFWPITPPEWEVDLGVIQEYTQKMSLEESMKMWEERLGKEKWQREDHPYVIYYRAESEAFTRWLIVAAVVAGIGVVLLILSMVVPSGRRSRPEK